MRKLLHAIHSMLKANKEFDGTRFTHYQLKQTHNDCLQNLICVLREYLHSALRVTVYET